MALRDRGAVRRPGAHLSNLTRLYISANRLAELPPGFFRVLARLGELNLDRNPGAPFPVALELDRSDTPDVLAPGPAEVVVRAPGTFPAALAGARVGAAGHAVPRCARSAGRRHRERGGRGAAHHRHHCGRSRATPR